MSAMERSAIAQQQVQQVAEKKARQQQLLHEDWQYARSQADIARNMASQANQVSVQTSGLPSYEAPVMIAEKSKLFFSF